MGTFNSNALWVKRNVASEYNRLKDIFFISLNVANLSNWCLTATFSNIRSLRKHLQEIKKHNNLIENGVLSLTETRVCCGNNISDIREKLDGFWGSLGHNMWKVSKCWIVSLQENTNYWA